MKDMKKDIDSDSVKDYEEKPKSRASSVKIAYCVQRMLEKNMDATDIIPVILLLFDRRDLKKFAYDYRRCLYMDRIRRIANFIHGIRGV